MKTTQVYYHQGKFLFNEKGWPIHIYSDHPDESKSGMFQQALAKAIAEAIPFEDQEEIALKVYKYLTPSTSGLYTIPEVEIEKWFNSSLRETVRIKNP